MCACRQALLLSPLLKSFCGRPRGLNAWCVLTLCLVLPLLDCVVGHSTVNCTALNCTTKTILTDCCESTIAPQPNMATTSLDHKPATDRISDDISPTAIEDGHGHAASSSKIVAPPLVAAMTPEQRVLAEDKLRRKIDIRLLPMIILMYIMNYLGEFSAFGCDFTFYG